MQLAVRRERLVAAAVGCVCVVCVLPHVFRALENTQQFSIETKPNTIPKQRAHYISHKNQTKHIYGN